MENAKLKHENERQSSHYVNQLGGSSKNLKIELPYDPAVPLLHPIECKLSSIVTPTPPWLQQHFSQEPNYKAA
jgi:hypothetical protein